MANNLPAIPNYGQHQKASFFKSTNDQPVRYNQFEPQQQQFLNQLLQSLQGQVGNLSLPGSQQGGDNLSFEPIRQQALGNFEKGLPSIAERFLSMGSSGARPSDYSGFGQQIADSYGDLQGQLASLGAEYGLRKGGLDLQRQGLQSNNLMSLLQMALQPQSDIGVIPGQRSGVGRAWDSLLGAGLQAGSSYLGGMGLGSGLRKGGMMGFNGLNQP